MEGTMKRLTALISLCVLSTLLVACGEQPAAVAQNDKEDDAPQSTVAAQESAGRLRIAVAPLRTNHSSFDLGGRSVPADDVLASIQRQLIDALAQTGRFTVLDRDFGAEIERELSLVIDGQTSNPDFAILGEALSADRIWVGTVNDFNYTRYARQLRTSSRELVSFSGGWSVSFRLINVATRQSLVAITLKGQAPEVTPTTLGVSVNLAEVRQGMEADIVNQAAEAIILRTFPISRTRLPLASND
jgi:curli biogenesis system outer membrane secretion channel CsgG